MECIMCLMKSIMYTCLYACLVVLAVDGTLISIIMSVRFMRDIWEGK